MTVRLSLTPLRQSGRAEAALYHGAASSGSCEDGLHRDPTRTQHWGEPKVLHTIQVCQIQVVFHFSSQYHSIITDKDKLQGFIHKMDQKLGQISLEEAATPVKPDFSGSIVPPRQESDSSFHSIETAQDSSFMACKAVEQRLPLGPIKLEDQLHLPFCDCSAPECDAYPWRLPELSCKSFRAPRQFCEDGQRIPFLFEGSEQLSEAALQIPVGAKLVSLVQAALFHQCDEAA